MSAPCCALCATDLLFVTADGTRHCLNGRCASNVYEMNLILRRVQENLVAGASLPAVQTYRLTVDLMVLCFPWLDAGSLAVCRAMRSEYRSVAERDGLWRSHVKNVWPAASHAHWASALPQFILFYRLRSLHAWLVDLDGGVGCLLCHFDVLAQTFQADLWKLLTACANDVSSAASVLDTAKLEIWDALAIKKMGHKILFAQGVKQLSAATRPSIGRRHSVRINLPRREA